MGTRHASDFLRLCIKPQRHWSIPPEQLALPPTSSHFALGSNSYEQNAFETCRPWKFETGPREHSYPGYQRMGWEKDFGTLAVGEKPLSRLGGQLLRSI
jgi:hypothetical protein